MKKVSVTCNECSRDITTTSNSEGYRIVLASERMPSAGGFVTDMADYPDFPEALHFCNWKCFDKWMRRKVGGDSP